MNAEIRRLRINLLRQLKASDPMSLPVSALVMGAHFEGFDMGEKQVTIECEHLADPSIGLIRVVDERFSRAIKRYKLTAEGREWLAEQGF